MAAGKIGDNGRAAAAAGSSTEAGALEDARRREEAPVVEEREASVLLDTGASGRNFISSKLASWLIERGSTMLLESGEVGLAQQKLAIQFHQHVAFAVRFFNLSLNVYETIFLSATVIEDLRIDVILGLPTVGKYGLLPKLTDLCKCCTPTSGASQELVCSRSMDQRKVSPNVSNSPKESLLGSLTTEIDQSARAQAPSVPQPGVCREQTVNYVLFRCGRTRFLDQLSNGTKTSLITPILRISLTCSRIQKGIRRSLREQLCTRTFKFLGRSHCRQAYEQSTGVSREFRGNRSA